MSEKKRYAILVFQKYARVRGSTYIWLRENGKVVFLDTLKKAKEKAKSVGGTVYRIGRNLQDKNVIGTYNNSFHRGKWLDTRVRSSK